MTKDFLAEYSQMPYGSRYRPLFNCSPAKLALRAQRRPARRVRHRHPSDRRGWDVRQGDPEPGHSR